MTASTLTLTDFLLARIAEDEAVAESATSEPVFQGLRLFADGYGTDVIARSRVSVLAECEAKRRIVGEHGIAADLHEQDYCQTCGLTDGFEWGGVPYPCFTLRALALPYADHPDYRQEWRP